MHTELYDFDGYQRILRYYGGASGKKETIVIDNARYILKYPQSLGNLKNRHSASYSNSPISEYVGSHVYEALGIPVHETRLGTSRGHIVVACKDFLPENKNFFEFSQALNSYFPDNQELLQEDSKGSSAVSTLLVKIMDVLENNRDFAQIRQAITERFWDMFVIDALIANPDRNNGNWGVFVDKSGRGGMEIAPVYDNGNSLNCKWDEKTMQNALSLASENNDSEFLKTASIFTRYKNDGMEHKINPFSFIASRSVAECSQAVLRLVPRLEEALPAINSMIDGIDIITPLHKDFLKASLWCRFENHLYKSFLQIQEQGLTDDDNSRLIQNEIGSYRKE